MKKIRDAYLKIGKSKIYLGLLIGAIVSLLTYQFFPNDYSFPIFLGIVICMTLYMIYFIWKEVRHGS